MKVRVLIVHGTDESALTPILSRAEKLKQLDLFLLNMTQCLCIITHTAKHHDKIPYDSEVMAWQRTFVKGR